MNQNAGIEKLPDGRVSRRGPRDADILLLWREVFKARANELDSLLDLSLAIASTAPDFPQKTDLESGLKRALLIVRNFA